jgi:beta-glucosidase
VKFQVTNSGKHEGEDVPQVYVSPVAGGWEAPKRLAGWWKVDLKPGATASVELRVDPRLLAMFSEADNAWRITAGNYKVMLGASAMDLKLEATIELPGRSLAARYDSALHGDSRPE